jgi:hypothetical protein
MQQNEVPDRRIGLIAGMIGGVIGMAAMRYYEQHIEPWVLPMPPVLEDPGLSTPSVGDSVQSPASAPEAIGRVMYTNLTGVKPLIEAAKALDDLVQWVYGIGAGGAYGATRTTTAPRDLAGGFFYGIRLWLGDTVLLNLFLRRDLTAISMQDHLKRLLQVWIFSFVTTAVTRLLYLLIA